MRKLSQKFRGRLAVRGLLVGCAAACLLLLAQCAEKPRTESGAQQQADRQQQQQEPQAQPVDLTAVQAYSNLGHAHTTQPVRYAQIPPVGGNHNPEFLNCGIYDEPVTNENAVHSLEHGAVWITYRPDLPEAAVATLRGLVQGQDHLILSPYPDLPAPVVASAWGVQLRLTGADDPRLPLFIKTYVNGSQAPEPGGTCVGGVGEPLAR